MTGHGPDLVADRLERLLAAPPVRVHDLGTSHEWSLHRALLADGREVFVKAARGPAGGAADHAAGAGPGEPAGVFAAESAGLGWLAEPGLAAVPEVLAADAATLVLPWLEPERPTAASAERLGRELAALHAAGAGSYGAPWPGFIAELPLDNTAGSSWPEWYAARRLVPYLRIAADEATLSAADVRLVERVISGIAGLAGPAEPPARTHGDLWSGNVLWSAGRGWLVDPAAHGGHRETDLAMLGLFGAPHLDRILAAYQEVSPLAAGWRARVPLHQLHPLLVHVALFGTGYRARLLDAANAALRPS